MSSTRVWSCKRSKNSVRNIYKNTECRKEFDCTMCTALKFIPEWLFTMLPFENERNASIFLQSRKILLHPKMHPSVGYGPQLLHGNGQGKTQTTIRQALQFQSPTLKSRGAFWCIAVAICSEPESTLAAANSSLIQLALLQEEVLYGHAEASMYSLFGAATLKYSGFSAAGTFKRPLGLLSFGKKSCW